MLHVSTIVKPSNIHGVGLFSLCNIPKGFVVWTLEKPFYLEVSNEDFNDLSHLEQRLLMFYGWFSDNRWIRVYDDSQFINHSFNPNLKPVEERFCLKAGEEIRAGEELTEDYTKFETITRPEFTLKGD